MVSRCYNPWLAAYGNIPDNLRDEVVRAELLGSCAAIC